jgi:hypothetical protein
MRKALIALRGDETGPDALGAAFSFCAEMRCAVHILLADASGDPPPVLTGFLNRLKQAGLEFRLFRHAGPLNRAVLDHTRAHRDIDVILLDDMKHWGHDVPFRTLPLPVGVLGGGAAA